MANKNFIMIGFSLFSILLSIIVHLLHRQFHFLDAHAGTGQAGSLEQNIVLLLPIVFFLLAIIFYKMDREHVLVPLFVTSVLTFSSISIIAGGDGLVEYHFSIFFVISLIAYYDSIKLLLISTLVFAIHHFLGYFLFPEMLCGTEEYSFSLLMIHAIFLILTSGANMVVIFTKKRSMTKLEAEKQLHKQTSMEVVNQLKYTSQGILKSVQELSAGSEESTKASQEIAVSVQDLTLGANEQLTTARESEKLILNMSHLIQEITTLSGLVNRSSNHTSKLAMNGKIAVDEMVGQMNTIDSAVQDLTGMINSLEEKSAQINSITSLITDLSAQTRMLSLNASIEAARAGEQGKGFAVVAEEVRKLAAQTDESSSKIEKLLESVTQEINKVKQGITHSSLQVQEGISTINTTNKTFTEILAATETVETQIVDITTHTENMLHQSKQAVQTVSQMREGTENSLSYSEQIAASTQQQLDSIELLHQISNSLTSLVRELEEVVNKTNSDNMEPS